MLKRSDDLDDLGLTILGHTHVEQEFFQKLTSIQQYGVDDYPFQSFP